MEKNTPNLTIIKVSKNVLNFFNNYHFLFIFFLILSANTYSQVSNYAFSETSGTYNQINGSSAIGSDWDNDVTSNNIPIGFTFNFNGTNYTTCSINSNGYITFGTTTSSDNNYTPISSNASYNGAISALGVNLEDDDNQAIRYQTSGSSGNRIFTVQWRNTKRKARDGQFNFQIKLYESTNVIQIHYGNCSPEENNSVNVQVGLRGSSDTDFNNRKKTNTGSWQNSTTNGTADNDTCRTRNGTAPSNGLIFQWTPCPTSSGVLSGNQYICRYSNTTTTFSSTVSGGTWSSSNTGVATVNASTGAVSAINSGTAIITYSVGGGTCPIYTSTRTVYVANGPGAGPLGISGSQNQCVSTTATYTITPDPYSSSYNWFYQGSGVTISPAADGLSATVTYSASATSGNLVVQSTNGCGMGGGGIYHYITVTPIPSTPSTNGAYSPTCSGFVAQWGYSNNATSYVIDVSTNNTFTQILPQYNNFNVGNTLNYTFSDLNSGTTYFYRVRATSSCGTSNSSSTMNYATLSGPANPANPTSNSPQCSPSNVIITRSGTPPSNVTWYWQTTATGTSTANSGVTYTVNTSGTYYIRARSSNGCWSNGAGSVNVLINSTPSITANPVNSNIIPGANTSFSVAASNSPTSYLWQVSTDGGSTWSTVSNGGVYSNATTATLNITNASETMNGYRYRASATNQCGTSSFSTAATLTVVLNYCIPTTQVTDRVYINRIDFVGTLNDVTNGSTFSSNGYQDFTNLSNRAIQAQGEGVNIILNSVNINNATTGGRVKAWIDWNKDGVFSQNATEEIYNPGPYAGANLTFGFIIPANTQPGLYRIRFRVYNTNNNSFGYDFSPCENFTGNRYSDVEDYLFEVIPSCSANIVSVTDGSTCGSGPVTISATGTSNTTSYRWYTSETSTTPIAGATGSSYTTPSLSTTTTYYVTAFNGSCESVIKTPVVANITPTPTITISPQNPVICGENAVISIVAGGDKETVTLVNEDFESNTLGAFNNVNNDPNNNTVDAKTAWQIKSSSFIPTGGIVWYPAISSGIGNNKFALATSDINPTAGSTIENSLTLASSVNTNDFLNLTLRLKMFYSRELPNNDNSYDEYVKIQVSTDNGSNWTDIDNILSDVGIGTRFASLNYDLSAYVNQANVSIRVLHRAFSSSGMWLAGGVAVDNIKLYGEKTLSTSFNYDTSVVDAFMDFACTIPYTSGTPATTIYIRPTVTQLENAAFIIPVSTTLSNGCVVSGNVNVTNNTKLYTPSATNTDWNTPTNWRPVGVPTDSNCIVVYEDVTITGPNNVEKGLNLIVKSGKKLKIESGNSLVITDFVNVEPTGIFEIDNNSSLVQINNITNTGNITYKRTAENIKGSDYVYWSSPVNNQALNTIYTSPVQGPKYKWNTLFNNGNGANGNISQGNWVNANGNIMETGTGYIVRGSNNFGMAATNINSAFIGRPNNGIIPVTIHRGNYTGSGYIGANGSLITRRDDNHNLIGNPYPSAINALQFINDNSVNIEGYVKLWTHGTDPGTNNGTTITNPFYGTFSNNYSASDYLTINFTGSNIPTSTELIKAGQAFFVEMLDGAAGSGTVLFNNNQRRDNSGNPYANDDFFRMSNEEETINIENFERHRIWLDIKDANNNSEIALVGYVEGATMDKDSKYDALSSTMNLNIYSIIDNEKFSIQGRSLPFNDDDEVAIGFNVPASGNYTLGINTADGLFLGNQDIYLKDEQLGIYHDLKSAPYAFTATSGVHNDRFKLVYKNTVLSNVTFNENEIQIAKNNNSIEIVSGNEIMSNVKVYDVRGRLIVEKNKINDNKISIDTNNVQDQVLIVNIVTSEGIKVTRKIL